MIYFTHFSAQPQYDVQFWNTARGKATHDNFLSKGYSTTESAFRLPTTADGKMAQVLKKESLFHNIATVINTQDHDFRIFAKYSDDMAMYVPASGVIPVYDGVNDFNIKNVDSHKLAVFVKLDSCQ